MEYRRLGRTGLEVSVVGFGTNQLRLVPPRQAVDTLLRGFELGVNIVHTSADYEGAEDLVAQAIARAGRKVVVAANAYDVHHNAHGPARHFERLFEATCARLGTRRLDLFGIAAVEDREAYGENVWGEGGMVEFLARMKGEGRLGGSFCTSHGEPAYLRRLVESGAFDAIMVSYNPLGHHLLSLNPPPGRHFENLARNRLEIFPLCRERDVGLMIMMPLAGGLLADSLAFPARRRSEGAASEAGARDILRSILADPEVTCVMPGTASPAEAEDNAAAGEAPIALEPKAQRALQELVLAKQSSLCSRCGACDALCSRQLPVSWLFRAAYIALYPSATFETWPDVEYFRLHPSPEPACASCTDATCGCPYGIDIPAALAGLHGEMTALSRRGLVAPALDDASRNRGDATFGARILIQDLPEAMRAGETRACRLYLENTGARGWFRQVNPHRGGAFLAVFVDGVRTQDVWPRDDIHAGQRGHFVFELQAPADRFELRLQMLGEHEGFSESAGFVLFSGGIGADGHRALAEESEPRGWWRRLFGVDPSTAAAHAAGIAAAASAPERPYEVRWVEHNLPEAWTEDEPCQVNLCAENLGSRPWRAGGPERVDLVVRLDGAICSMVPVPHDVAPGERVTLRFALTLPAGLGDWVVGFSFLEQNVAWFERHGVRPLTARIRRMPADRVPEDPMAIAGRSNSSFHTPSRGVACSRDGRAYPLIIREARGARIRDPKGREWIDYVMGYGSALLGYAHPEIAQAVGRALDCGAILSLPHEREMEVTAALCEVIPSAETVLFGKNGSDACTAAVRVARVHTGRTTILFSGFHGWQEPFANAFEPALPAPDARASAFRFRLNDLEGFCRLVAEHSGRIAAVMLEPAAQVEGVDGPVRDCDPAFLRHVAEICRAEGAVLVFDEIMTGFRYARGSVQRATGVLPDLTCLGKGLSAGMPLSALVGRREIMQPALARIFYHPTFKGEAYSFAAAAAALRIYRSEDVHRRLREFSQRLRQGVDGISRELGVPGRMVGLPFRMAYRFDEGDERLRACKRTLLQQELVLSGVLTFRGFMLPSLAHGDAELDQTLAAYRAALTKVRDVAAKDAFASQLEIDLVV